MYLKSKLTEFAFGFDLKLNSICFTNDAVRRRFELIQNTLILKSNHKKVKHKDQHDYSHEYTYEIMFYGLF